MTLNPRQFIIHGMVSLIVLFPFWVATSSDVTASDILNDYSGDYTFAYYYYYDPVWSVKSGECGVDTSGCILSPNYPSSYGADQSCEIAVDENYSLPLHFFRWHIEEENDYLTINGETYSGSDVFPRGVKARGLITWTSNDAKQRMGWRICPFACADKAQGTWQVSSKWTDKAGNNCSKYGSSQWCTARGQQGKGWNTDWGSIADMKAEEELDATQACCYCGGGERELPATVSPEDCQTVGKEGLGDGHHCVFPFTYDGTEYNQCTTISVHREAWCSTMTDSSGKHVEGHWGNCAAACFLLDTPSGLLSDTTNNCRTQGRAGLGAGLECKLPFTYEGVVYNGCITRGNDGKPWCSAHRDDDGVHKDGQWGECVDECPLDEKGVEPPKVVPQNCETTGNDRKACQFPFTYEAVTHNECINSASDGPWCSTLTDAEGKHTEGNWGVCGEGCPVVANCTTIPDGTLCAFPFVYQEVTYSECITLGSDKPWCSTQIDADGKHKEGQWGICGEACPSESCKTIRDEKACKFPFTYKQVIYNKCAAIGGEQPWCSTLTDAVGEHTEGNWGICVQACPVEICKTIDDEKACQFPFIYQGTTHNTCITTGSADPWCSTEIDAEGNHKEGYWGLCDQACPVESCKIVPDGTSCALPFVYKEVTYNGCITIGSESPWCSTELDADGKHKEGQWGICGEACPVESCKTIRDEKACKFPFTYRQVIYNKCTEIGSDQPWCSTQTDADGEHTEGNWGICGQACPMESCKTIGDEKACQFPFIYEETTHNKCITASSGNPWCSTETDADGKHKEGYWGLCGQACPVESCKTVPDGTSCIFPFVYKEKTYNECIIIGADKPWCSTEIDADGKHKEGHWGMCGGACLVESCKTVRDEKACKFPFTYKQVTHNECTIIGSEQPWCSTKTDASGEHTEGDWGICGQACPVESCKTMFDEMICQFPFVYEETTHNECITLDSENPWCSTKLDAEGNHIEGYWGLCDQSCPVERCETVPDGTACVFPFVYNEVTYNACITIGSITPWCSTELDVDGNHREGYWGLCGQVCPVETCKTNPDLTSCAFPFVYKEVTYNECITSGSDKPWCSTEIDADGKHKEGQWGICGEACPVASCKTVPGGTSCKFPFVYKEATYNECTIIGLDKPWCSTELDADGKHKDGQWGICGEACPVESCKTVRDETTCKFPFTYKQVIHNECTITGSDQPWCSTQTDAAGEHTEGNWGICGQACPVEICKTVPDGTFCQLPFVYKEISYYKCIAIGLDKPWCSTEIDADGKHKEGQWGICGDACPVESCKTVRDQKACDFPFTYKERTYNECTTIGSDQPWCSTQTDADGEHTEGNWGICGQACPKESCKTIGDEKACQFPFIYEETTHNECITTSSGNPWCSTETDAEGKHKEGYWGLCGQACPVESCKTIPDGRTCKFPFAYKGVTYNKCISMGSDKPWCSTEIGADGKHKEGQWGTCGEACPVESCKTIRDEKPCRFPFIYKETTHNECITFGSDNPWCSTEVDAEGKHEEGYWGLCGPACPVESCKTVPDRTSCKFPFVYKEVTYNGCAMIEADKPWCATQIDADGNFKEGYWGFCMQACPVEKCKTERDETCKLPFIYKTVTYNECTKTGSDQPWCSTQTNAEGEHTEGQWGLCGQGCAVESCKTIDDKKECKFPFTYEGTKYNECTSKGFDGNVWCSTQIDAKGNHLEGYWGICGQACPAEDSSLTEACVTIGGRPCQFPFKYERKTYTTCTKAGGSSNHWCSTQTDLSGFHVAGQWANCGAACPTEDTGETSGGCITEGTGEACQFPFIYEGKTYTQCTTVFSEGKPWCSTQIDSGGNHVAGRWDRCGRDCLIGKDDLSGTDRGEKSIGNQEFVKDKPKPSIRGGDAPRPKNAPASTEEPVLEASNGGGIVFVSAIAGVALLASALIFCFCRKDKGAFQNIMPTQYGRQYRHDGL